MNKFVGWLNTSGTPSLNSQSAPQFHDGCSVFCCGYIANVSALVEESKKRSDLLKGTSYPELFAKAYRWWGEKLQSHVLGEYAVAIYNHHKSTLLLTRDSLGLVPLFYSVKKEILAFASHLEELVVLTGIGDIDEEYIADYLATCTVISARTPYKHISRILPGYSLHWSNRRIQLHKSWDIARIQPVNLGCDVAYEERFRDLLCEGIKSAIHCDGKVWSELSGGLDSSSIVSMAAQMGMKDLEVFSVICKSSRSADESIWMKAVVSCYALKWHTLDADDSRPFSELPQNFCAEPSSALAAAGLLRCYYSLAEAHGVRVILSGDGGDAVLCGDSPEPFYLADFLPGRLHRLLKSLRHWSAEDPHRRSFMHRVKAHVILPYYRFLRGRSLRSCSASEISAWIQPEYRRRMHLEMRGAHQVAPRCNSVGHQYQAEQILNTGFSAQFALQDKLESLEFRKPLLYRPLVEFMMSIPWEQKIQPHQDRALQRRALIGILPEKIRLRRGKGDLVETYSEGLRKGIAWCELLLSRPRIVERGYVDAKLWTEAVNQARYAKSCTSRQFLAAATLEVWLRQLENSK